MKHQFKVGEKNNKLTFIEEISGGKVKCICECGNITITRKTSFKTGRVKSCGCNQRKWAKIAGESKRKKYGEALKNKVFYQLRKGAEKRNIPFNLTFDEVMLLSQENCKYCGSFPSTVEEHPGRYYGKFVYNGVDRVDNEKGYTKENCVACCIRCNRMKTNLTVVEFKTHITQLYRHFVTSNNSDTHLLQACQPVRS